MSSPAPRRPTPPPAYNDPATLTTSLKPYLTLPYLLSLTWLAYPILSILFVIFRLQVSLGSAENAVSDAKDNMLASCKAAEQSATSAASLPRYMAIGTNKQIVDAVNGTLNGARETLILSLTVMEAIINFLIDIYRSTFLCFLELVIRGGLSILIAAVEELQKFVQITMSGIRTSIQGDVANANSAMSSTINGINKAFPFAHIKPPQFSIPSLDALNNVTLSTTFQAALSNLNSSIPSIESIRNSITGLVDTPFELVKKDINDTFLGFSYNVSSLPVPQINTVSFCDQLDTGIVDNLGLELVKVAQIGMIVLIILALLLLAFHCLLEWYKWRCLRKSLERTRSAWSTDPTIYHVTAVTLTPSLHMTDHNLLTLHAISSHPLLSRIANWIAALCHLTPSQFVHLQFFLHYIFHPPALACFLIGFFGLLSVELQLLALGPVQDKFSQQASASASSLSNSIATSMNVAMQNQSSVYVNSVNGQLATMQSSINDGLFGWVNSTTTTLNNTLVTFYADVQKTVNIVFGGTVLDQPAQDFVRCIIGSKVQALENVLTFLNTNLHVNLPVLNDSALALSPAQVNEAAQPISAAAVGSGGSGQGIVGRVVNRYISDLKKERFMFAIFICLWGVVVVMALCIIFWHSYGKVWWHAYKRRRWQRGQRKDVDNVVRPWTGDSKPSVSMPSPHFAKEKEKPELVSFTPLCSQERPGFFAALKMSAAEIHWPRSEERTNSDSTSHSSQGDSCWKKPTKLMAIGRKALGQERLVPDQDPESQSRENHGDKGEVLEVQVSEENGNPWWRRMWTRRTSIDSFEGSETFKKKGQVFEDKGEVLEVQASENGNPWWRRKWNRRASIGSFESSGDFTDRAPLITERRTGTSNLTILTDIIPAKSQRDHFSLIVRDEPEAEETPREPASAWSISPVTRPTPWTQTLPAVRFPLRQNQTATPPLVGGMDIPPLTFSKVAPPRPIPPPHRTSIPIHYGFVRPVPHETPSTPPPTSPVHNASSILAPLPVDGRLTNNRPSSQAMADDPFATCFDDEHRVRPDPPAKHVSNTPNPFGDMGTPRAV